MAEEPGPEETGPPTELNGGQTEATVVKAEAVDTETPIPKKKEKEKGKRERRDQERET